jgi:serine/threonine-protein kinase
MAPIGQTLSHYEIVEKLGQGGMGEVYRAHDTKLNRDVALKVLPSEFAENPERMARFKREAQLLASLNHPNIAAIYGLEESNGLSALIMELAEGPTLADRISRGPIAAVFASTYFRSTSRWPALARLMNLPEEARLHSQQETSSDPTRSLGATIL